MKTIKKIILLSTSTLFVSSCLPVMVAGMFYSSNQSKQMCANIMAAPDFLERMKIPEYREFHQKVCKPKNKEDFESAVDPTINQ